MVLDPKSASRLEALGRKLPRPLPSPIEAKTEQARKLHPVETEQNPEELFRQLMNISPDGKIPDHLLDRLRSAEKLAQEKRENSSNLINKISTNQGESSSNKFSNFHRGLPSQKDNSYTEFQQLLLEQED
jgi:hypothetical protein